MKARGHGFWLVVSVLIWSQFSLPLSSAASVVFDDHFEGDSGGVPAGWSGFGDGSVIEAGTTVTFHDEYAIGTDNDLDPCAADETIIRHVITSTTNHTHVGFIDFEQMDNHIWIKLWATDGRIEVKASDAVSGEEEIVAGYASGYAGGEVLLTIRLEAESFSVSTDTPPFTTGPIAYSSVFTSFTRADLGHAVRLVLQNECEPAGPPCTSVYDRVTVETAGSTDVLSASWGNVKTMYHVQR